MRSTGAAIDLTIGWTPETDLVVVEGAKDDVGSQRLVGVAEKEGESWPVREVKDVLKGG